MTEEVRITSATGGQKGKKPAQLGALDPHTLLTLAEVAGFGAEKYDAHNFLKGYDWSLTFNAAQRHLLAFWGGEEVDSESGLSHLGHAAWHCLALLAFAQRDIGTDDRPPAPPEPLTGAERLREVNRRLVSEKQAAVREERLRAVVAEVQEGAPGAFEHADLQPYVEQMQADIAVLDSTAPTEGDLVRNGPPGTEKAYVAAWCDEHMHVGSDGAPHAWGVDDNYWCRG